MLRSFLFSLSLIFLIHSAAEAGVLQGAFNLDVQRRGYPSCYDPGPKKDSNFAKLFGQAPNYRAIGKFLLGGSGEKFRWKFGPMWYRGRLGQNEVKVLVIGQEGAQDENLSNRAFTGSTGTRTQNFLNHIGITKSYLFLNTFVYTINGQLDHKDELFKWMEQNPDSPIVEYRHKLFNETVRYNSESLSLLMGVGRGGKDSLATWIKSHQPGLKCSLSSNPNTCPIGEDFKRNVEEKFNVKLRDKIIAIGVPHPGAAGKSGAAAGMLIKTFSAAASNVAEEMSRDKNWLHPDDNQDVSKVIDRAKDFRYAYAPVPFCDFAFGTNWRMGNRGTTSNRRTSSAIQIFSADGKYNNDGDSLSYPSLTEEESYDLEDTSYGKKLASMHNKDVPYEPPRYHGERKIVDNYSYGPCAYGDKCTLGRLLQTWPNFYTLDGLSYKPKSSPSFGTGPIYRGRLDNARVLILADQGSHDDFFSARALTGKLGQELQAYLEHIGAYGLGSPDEDTIQYAIVRTLPVDTLGDKLSDVKELALHSEVRKSRDSIIKEILNEKKTTVILTLGPVAEAAAQEANNWDFSDNKIFHLSSDSSRDWKQQAESIIQAADLEEGADYWPGKFISIPRKDLPIHTRWWMGSTSNRAVRGVVKSSERTRGKKATTGDYYKVFAPKWVSRLKPVPLSSKERDSIQGKLKGEGLSARSVEGR